MALWIWWGTVTTFRVQAIGDAGLLLAISLIYVAYGRLDLGALFQMLKKAPIAPVFFSGTWWETTAPSAITVVLVLTIMTNSAQFPFHVWLPGTIEAPTPVSESDDRFKLVRCRFAVEVLRGVGHLRARMEKEIRPSGAERTPTIAATQRRERAAE